MPKYIGTTTIEVAVVINATNADSALKKVSVVSIDAYLENIEVGEDGIEETCIDRKYNWEIRRLEKFESTAQ